MAYLPTQAAKPTVAIKDTNPAMPATENAVTPAINKPVVTTTTGIIAAPVGSFQLFLLFLISSRFTTLSFLAANNSGLSSATSYNPVKFSYCSASRDSSSANSSSTTSNFSGIILFMYDHTAKAIESNAAQPIMLT